MTWGQIAFLLEGLKNYAKRQEEAAKKARRGRR